ISPSWSASPGWPREPRGLWPRVRRRKSDADREPAVAETPHPPPLPSELAVVPLRGAVVLPMTVAPLGVSRGVSVEAVNRALAGDRMVLLLLQKNDSEEPAP